MASIENSLITFSIKGLTRVDICCTNCTNKKKRSSEEIKTCVWNNFITKMKDNRGRKIDFLISKEYVYNLFLKQNRKCALSGVEIKFADTSTLHSKGHTTASLDRIDSDRGYIEGNVQWLHKYVNIMKWKLSESDFLTWCSLIVNKNQKIINVSEFIEIDLERQWMDF